MNSSQLRVVVWILSWSTANLEVGLSMGRQLPKEKGVSVTPPKSVNPALLQHAQQRAESVENRVADAITRFAGSMRFVYVHIIWFTAWIVFRLEDYPFGLLTMIVSLEAIFLSTFVMISQNRADDKRQGTRRPSVANRAGRRTAERAVAQPVQPDSRTHPGHSRGCLDTPARGPRRIR